MPIIAYMIRKRNHTPYLYPEHAFSESLHRQPALIVPRSKTQAARFAQKIRRPCDVGSLGYLQKSSYTAYDYNNGQFLFSDNSRRREKLASERNENKVYCTNVDLRAS